MPLSSRLIAGVIAAVLAPLLSVLCGVIPFLPYELMFVIGPLALLWFAAAVAVVPMLIAKVPVRRDRFVRLACATAVPFAASRVYLSIVPEFVSNTGKSGAEVAWFGAGLALLALAGAGYLHERRWISVAYHVLLVAWLFGPAFPYTGEFL
jgi:hypothetical protein